MEQTEINKIKEVAGEFFTKMTIEVPNMEVGLSLAEKDSQDAENPDNKNKEVVNLDIKLDEPQILIGQQGQTLLEIQRLLRMVLNKRLQKVFYLNLDINGYKKQKMEYLEDIAKDLADQVALTRKEKVLSPMSAYERRIIHSVLSNRTDVATESRGEGFERCIVIKPR